MATSHASTRQTRRRHYRATLQAANRANAAGQYANARELFFELYMLKGRIETRLSAANMTLKLGEVAAALAEYQYFDDELFGTLTPKGQKVLRVKLAEAEKLVKRQQQQQQQGAADTDSRAQSAYATCRCARRTRRIPALARSGT